MRLLSKNNIGATFGGAMLASLSSGAADAAGNDCKNIDIGKQPNVSAAFQACLAGTALTPGAAIVYKEIENRGCTEERNRATGQNSITCMVTVPRDVACPTGTTSESRLSNAFDPKNTVDGRKIGTKRCEFRGIQPGAAPQ